jgi:3-oxoacyl-[acyl-carrier-protein] synthase-1
MYRKKPGRGQEFIISGQIRLLCLTLYEKNLAIAQGLTGWVNKPNLKELLDRRSRIMLPEQGEYAYVATLEALKNAGLMRIICMKMK